MVEIGLVLLLLDIGAGLFIYGQFHALPVAAAICLAGHLLRSK